MIKLATVGTSPITDSFLEAARCTGRFSLEAVYSRSSVKAEAFAVKHGAKRSFSDIDKMASDTDIDAVYIASPNSLHYEQCRLFLENGKHVICEKPIVLKLSDLLSLKELAKENGLVLMEAMISVHTDSAAKLKEAIGKIGKTESAEFIFSKVSNKYELYKRGEFINVFEHSMGGGALFDLGIYPVYASVYLFGEPDDIRPCNFYDERNNNLCGNALLDYGDFQVKIVYSKVEDGMRNSRIVASEGRVEIGLISMFSSAEMILNDKITTLSPPGDRIRVMMFEANDFADYVSGKRLDEYEEFSGLMIKAHRVMEKIYNKGAKSL